MAEREHCDVAGEIDQPVDDVHVEPGQCAAEDQRRLHHRRIVDLVDEVLVRQQAVNRSQPRGQPLRHRPHFVALVEAEGEEDAHRRNAYRRRHQDQLLGM